MNTNIYDIFKKFVQVSKVRIYNVKQDDTLKYIIIVGSDR